MTSPPPDTTAQATPPTPERGGPALSTPNDSTGSPAPDAPSGGLTTPAAVLPEGEYAQVSFYDLGRALAWQLAAEGTASASGRPPHARRHWAVRAVLIDAGGGAQAPPRRGVGGDDLRWDDERDQDIRLGAVRLVSRSVTSADFSRPSVRLDAPGGEGSAGAPSGGAAQDPGAVLRRLLLTAAPTLRDGGALDPAPGALISVRRSPGRSRWLEEPCWVATWTVAPPQHVTSPPMPHGRMFSAAHHLYFEGVPEASAGWCRDEALAQKHTTEPVYHVVIPDDRAYFADVVRTDEGLDVTVAGTSSGALYCVAVIEDGDVQRTEVLDLTCSGNVEGGGPVLAAASTSPAVAEQPSRSESRASDLGLPVRLPRRTTLRLGAPARLTLALFGEDGTSYDHTVFTGPAFAAAPGESLFDPAAAFLRARSRPLEDARRTGEGDRVEFKAWVPPDRRRGDDKTRELLETAVAFANARGGSIFVGIDDHGEVVGVRGNIDAAFGDVGRDDTPAERDAKRRHAYVQALRKLLVDGVAPTLAPEFRWHDVAGLAVLQVDIAQGTQRPYMLVENRAVHVRRGSTNAKPDTPELIALAGGTPASGVRGTLRGPLGTTI
jgi:hypothetical protein